MKHNMQTHMLWMVGGFIALILIGKIFHLNLVILYPLLCTGMMVFMMLAVSRGGHNNMHK